MYAVHCSEDYVGLIYSIGEIKQLQYTNTCHGTDQTQGLTYISKRSPFENGDILWTEKLDGLREKREKPPLSDENDQGGGFRKFSIGLPVRTTINLRISHQNQKSEQNFSCFIILFLCKKFTLKYTPV